MGQGSIGLHTEGRLASRRRLVPFGILSRYIARQLVKPFLLGFSVVTFLLTLDFLLDYLNLFLGKGISIWTVSKLFVLGLGWMVALSVPCGVLVAVLMAYGQMSQDNEITAMRASGINLIAAMVPSFLMAGTIAVGLTAFNNYVLPESNHAFANLVAQIHRVRPTAQIREGVFLDEFEGYDLFIGRLNDRTGEMKDVLIVDASENRRFPRTIVAKEGDLSFVPGTSTLVLTLRNGEIHELDPDAREARYRRLAFEEQTMQLQGASDALQGVRRGRGQREMSVGAMRQEIRRLEEERDSYEAQVDSSLSALGVSSPEQLPPLSPEERQPKGITKILAPLAALFGGRRPPPAPAEDLDPELRRQIEELRMRVLQRESVEKRIDSFRVEIQKKFSIPFACLVFVLVGAPLGMRARRGGLAVGFLSVAFFLFYYLCLIGGEQLADRGLLSPWLAMWIPNFVLGGLGLRETVRVATTGFAVSASRKVRRQ